MHKDFSISASLPSIKQQTVNAHRYSLDQLILMKSLDTVLYRDMSKVTNCNAGLPLLLTIIVLPM